MALATSFLLQVRIFYHSDTRFTSLIWFGESFAPQRLARLKSLPIYNVGADGYDGQFYAQIAVAGNPFDPELKTALDSPSYRNRRVLVPLVAYAAGLGDPTRVLDAYALLNVLVWLILAALLARWWFPPSDLHNLLRWAGLLFGVGMMITVARSLVDGPALLLIAAGVRAVERRRPILGALLLGTAGLARETSVLAAAALLPGGERLEGRRNWARAAVRVAICVLPAALWIAVLRLHFGYLGGDRNFAVPLGGFLGKLGELREGLKAGGFPVIRNELLVAVSVAAQMVFILARPRPREAWWGIGAAYAMLAVFLGEPVWEGNLSAAARVLLPLTLAFNVLVPRTRRGLVLLLVGNLTVFSAETALRPLPRSFEPSFYGGVTANYVRGWYPAEVDPDHSWRWSSGSAELQVRNPGAKERLVTIGFDLVSVTDRTVVIRVGDVQRTVALSPQIRTPVQLGSVVLRQGTTVVTFATDGPPWPEPGPVKRKLAFSVHDLFVR